MNAASACDIQDEKLSLPTLKFLEELLSLLFGFGTYFDLQPFSAIIRFGNRISNSWERRETQAPVSHAELMTLIELSAQPALGGDPAALKAKLEKAGLKVSSEHQNLADIAKSNGISAEKAYELLAPPRERKPKLALQGLGNKTLKQIADENGLSSTSLQLALRQKGVEAETNMPLKAIAEKNKIPMGELQQLLELMITH